MSGASAKTMRSAAGAACIAAVVAAFGCFALQFVPGEPRAPQPEEFDGSIDGVGNNRYQAERIVDVPFGQTYRAESLTRGKWFSMSEDERAALSDEERERLLNEFDYIYDSDGIEITPGDMRAVSLEAFAEWYPHYTQTLGYEQASRYESKVLLVDVTFSNTSDQEQRAPPIGLWSEDIKGANDVLDNGVGDGGGNYILEELYGEPSDRGLVQNHLPDDWNVLAAGETRTLTLPFLLPARPCSKTQTPSTTSIPRASAWRSPTTTLPPSTAFGWDERPFTPCARASSGPTDAICTPKRSKLPSAARRSTAHPTGSARMRQTCTGRQADDERGHRKR